MNRRELAAMIDHTLLKPEATSAMIDRLCAEAAKHGFAAVCVQPVWIGHCARLLRGTAVKVAGVAGFPLGGSRTDTKVDETLRALDDGAEEIDMVIRLGDLVAGDTAVVTDDIAAVAEAIHRTIPHGILKVILETAALTEEQIIAGCKCAIVGRADFVKTSTGFHPSGGATLEAVRLLREHAAPLKVKAAGGIRDTATAMAMIAAGAARLGTSAGVKIVGNENRFTG
ncbi:MAG: deoxyribose-phosphate aldolase [Phycisphaerales bacterium]|nr:deoxyribose-phosphate aldolase [Phycisphaerales bacterium]